MKIVFLYLGIVAAFLIWAVVAYGAPPVTTQVTNSDGSTTFTTTTVNSVTLSAAQLADRQAQIQNQVNNDNAALSALNTLVTQSQAAITATQSLNVTTNTTMPAVGR